MAGHDWWHLLHLCLGRIGGLFARDPMAPLVQSLLYVAAITLTIRRSRWGYFIGAATAGLWDMLALFASPLSPRSSITQTGPT
jgi:hypothetical protein